MSGLTPCVLQVDGIDVNANFDIRKFEQWSSCSIVAFTSSMDNLPGAQPASNTSPVPRIDVYDAPQRVIITTSTT